jgi:hypothetical protein
MSGLDDLKASQRAISNLLYQHAHDSGQIAVPGAVFEIPMARCARQSPNMKAGTDFVKV